MQIEICNILYTIEDKNTTNRNLLSILYDIKQKNNRSLSFRSGCKSGVCGSCCIRINGIEKLACKTIVKDGDIITPLNNLKVIKDLVVDINNKNLALQTAKSYLEAKSNSRVSSEDEKKIDIESNCILCNSCYSACPIYSVNENFISPFALMRNYRYVNDIKEDEIKTKLDAIQNNGIWDCTLCGNCNMVCPSLIDIKGAIEKLRNKSAQFGYNNPNMNMGFDTSLDFTNQNLPSYGFNPNGF